MTIFGRFRKTPREWFEKARRTELDPAPHKAAIEALVRDAERFGEGLEPPDESGRIIAKICISVTHSLDKALAIDPGFSPAWLAKGERFLYSKASLDDVLLCLDRALAGKPSFADAMYLKGRAFERKGADDLALTWYEKAVEINPDDAEAWHAKARLLNRQGRTEEAEACAKKAESLDPLLAPGARRSCFVQPRWQNLENIARCIDVAEIEVPGIAARQRR